ncbi:MAG: 50S ribosomal protein L10 [Candidatus Shikimatogenerans bostrichidophilus]|nr:MAG: 50S ribosomal protein L10 [Candidatus Shikimatogenerans bostrichidophilus]
MKNKKIKKKNLKLLNKYFKKYNNYYIINIYKYNCNNLFKIRKKCFNLKIKFLNIKNNLLKLIFKKKKKILSLLVNNNFIMFSKNINNPAKIIKNNKKLIDNKYYPILKLACINNEFYYGEKYLNFLCKTKSKNNLLIDIILILKNYIKYFIIFNIIKKKNNIINIINNIIKYKNLYEK